MVIIIPKIYQIKDSSTTSSSNKIRDLFSEIDLERKNLGKKFKPELESIILDSSKLAMAIRLPFFNI